MKLLRVIIKVLGIALAGIIIFSIIGAVIVVLADVSDLGLGFLGKGDNAAQCNDANAGCAETKYEIKDLKKIRMHVLASTVRVLEAEDAKEVRILTNNDHLETAMDGDTLEIIEKDREIWKASFTRDVVVILKKGMKFETAEIEVGAGTVEVPNLEAKTASLVLGAGKMRVTNLKVTGDAKIESGAGKMTIEGGEVARVNVGLGAGKTELKMKVKESGKFNAGVGKLSLELLGKEEDYKLDIEKGAGAIKVNGRKISDNQVVGEGKTLLEINAGVGALDIVVGEK